MDHRKCTAEGRSVGVAGIKGDEQEEQPHGAERTDQTKLPEIFTWTPVPGAVLDLGLALTHRDAVTEPPSGTKVFKDSWNFSVYLDELDTAVSSPVFKHKQWIEFYYKWAAFHNYNLVIRVIETDDDFQLLKDGYDYLVDFLDLSFPSVRPDRAHGCLGVKNRVNVMRYVVLNGLLWDDLYIGFNNQISRDPDIYHHKFRKHFQSDWPTSAPDWDGFLETVPAQESDQSSCTVV